MLFKKSMLSTVKATTLKLTLLGAFLFSTNVYGAEKGANKSEHIGIVDFTKCITDSKFGKFEQKEFESIKMQLQKAVQDLEAQLTDTNNKLQNKDFLDSLSPEAEKELKIKFQSLGEEMGRYQGQYYQVMQQANMKLVQTMSSLITEASDAVAEKDHFSLILNKETVFHCANTLEITDRIIQELDSRFEKEGLTLTNNSESSK